jgi:hopanoid biosynthesis associated RND transporter like protein HpnN
MMPEQPDSEAGTVAHRLLARLVSGVCRRPRTVLVLSLLVAGLSVFSLRFLEYRTQRSDLISPNKDSQKRWRQYLAEFGNDDDIVVVVKGHDRPQMQQALDALADKVRQQPALFDRLFYKVDLRSLQNRALLFLPTEQIRQIQDNLKSMSLLLELGPISWQSLTLFSLLHEARDRAGKIAPGKPLRPADELFLGQLLALSKSATATLIEPRDYRNPWGSLLPQAPGQQDILAQPQYFFSGDGSLAFLLTRPVLDRSSFTSARQSVDALREVVAGLRNSYPDLEFGLTGLPVLETDEMTAADHDTRLALWLAIAGVTLLFVIVYRGIYYPLLTVLTLLVGTAWAMGWLTLTVGHLNILSTTFAVMLIGTGDYGVLWVMRYEQARQGGMDVRSALLHTTQHVAIGNLTAAMTLALAFFAAMLADFQAVAELGWIAGCGVLLCALACFTVLPALLMLFDRRPLAKNAGVILSTGEQHGPRTRWLLVDKSGAALPIRTASEAPSWLPLLAGRARWVLAGGLACTAIMALCACRLGYDHNLLHLQASDLDSVKWELTLIEHTAGASWHALSYRDSPEEALALKARYEQLPEVSRVVEAASLVPAHQDEKLDLLRDIQHRLRRLPTRGALIPHGRPNLLDVKTELACLIGQLQPLADSSDQRLLVDLRHALKALFDELGNMPIALLGEERLQDFEQRLASDLAEDLYRLRDVATPLPIVVADLPPDFRERYISPAGKWLLRVFAKDCLWDFEPLAHFAEQIQTVDPEATGKPFGTVEGLRAMKNGFQRAGLYAFLVIVAVLAVDFRSVKNTLIAIAPLAIGVVLSLGIMGLFGLPLNPANMIAFPLILGVGVDNGVHVLHDYLLRRANGTCTISRAIGRGVLVKALTTMIGFGTLMISSERGLASLGFILTLGVCCCMVTALIFLPAVLHLLGGRRENGISSEDQRLNRTAA